MIGIKMIYAIIVTNSQVTMLARCLHF